MTQPMHGRDAGRGIERTAQPAPIRFLAADVNVNDFHPMVADGALRVLYVRKTPFERTLPDSKVPNRFGCLVSDDGLGFRDLGAVLRPGGAGAWDSSLWAGGAIAERGGGATLYYTGVDFERGIPTQRIGRAHAVGRDLTRWEKSDRGPVLAWRPNTYYSDAAPLVFRDPFPVDLPGADGAPRRHLLFSARSARTGEPCVGVAAERGGRFEFLPPAYEPSDGLGVPECPALYRLGGRWLLIVNTDGDGVARGVWSASPLSFPPATGAALTRRHDYALRLVLFRDRWLAYHWRRFVDGGIVREGLAGPYAVGVGEGPTLDLAAL